MEIKQLQSFVAVVEYGNFTKAAEKTFTSQPTISTHIRALEDELGEKLITRDTKHIEITAKGMELYECATHILDLQSNLVTRWREENHNAINIGASTVPSAHILPDILASFSKLYPDVSFTINQGDSEEITDGLKNGLYDLGFVGLDCGSDKIDCECVFEDETVIITPNTGKFAEYRKLKNVPYDILLQEPVIFREKGSANQRMAVNLLEKMGVSAEDLNIAARINDQETVKNLVEAGVGITIIPKIAVRKMEAAGRLLSFRLPGEIASRKFYMAVNRSAIKGEAVKSFMKFVKQSTGKLQNSVR